MNNEFDYYLHFPIMVPSTPAVRLSMEWDSDIDLDLVEEPLDDDFGPLPIVFEFDEPYPKKPNMVDCFSDLVVSSKVHSVLESLNIDGIQLFPAAIHDPKNKTSYDNYWYPHIHRYIECLDIEKSIYTKDSLDMVHMINKMALDIKALSKIPLENRLIFKLGELSAFTLFHESVVEKILAVNPTGIRFVKVEDYNIGSAFD